MTQADFIVTYCLDESSWHLRNSPDQEPMELAQSTANPNDCRIGSRDREFTADRVHWVQMM